MVFTEAMISITLMAMVPCDFRNGKIMAQKSNMNPATTILIKLVLSPPGWPIDLHEYFVLIV